MPILTGTDHYGTVDWLGLVPVERPDIKSVACDAVDADWAGFVGEFHSGLTRPSCVRVKTQYPRDTEIRNVRQISILSAEELAEVAARLDLSEILPEWVGANIILSGIPDFTLVPPASRLIFDGGVALTIDMENAPCRFPAEQIELAHPGHGKDFPKVAVNKRGVTAWVERPGRIARGERCRLHVPPQRLYPHI